MLDVALAKSIDILQAFEKKLKEPSMPIEEKKYPQDDNVLDMLHSLGYQVVSTSQAPFKARSKDNHDTMLTGVSTYSNAMIKRADLMSSISNVTQTRSVFIIKGPTKSDTVENTVLIEEKELDRVAGPDEFISLIDEKTKFKKS